MNKALGRFDLNDEGQVIDTTTGEVVAVDTTMGVVTHPFPQVEKVGTWEWDAERLKLLDVVSFADKPISQKKLAIELRIKQDKIRDWLHHPAFVRMLTLRQSKNYEALAAQRRIGIGTTLTKMLEKADELIDKMAPSMEPAEVRNLGTLLREIRYFRQTERVEHGEAANIVATFTKTQESDVGKSIMDLAKQHPDVLAALAQAIMSGHLTMASTNSGKATDADWREIKETAPEVPALSLPASPPTGEEPLQFPETEAVIEGATTPLSFDDLMAKIPHPPKL